MKNKTIALTALLLAAAGLGIWYVRSDVGRSVNALPAEPASGAEVQGPSDVQASTTDAPAPGTAPAAPSRSLPLVGLASTAGSFLCHQDSPCAASPFGAANLEEGRWLKSHGYPTQEELPKLKQASDQQLKILADSGYLPALVVYGERLAVRGDMRTGVAALASASEQGSIYAYYGLANVYAQNPKAANRSESGAFLRVAYMLGDRKAAEELQRVVPDVHPVEQVAIDRRAAELYKTFAKQRVPSSRPF